jgi:hypothetical protein
LDFRIVYVVVTLLRGRVGRLDFHRKDRGRDTAELTGADSCPTGSGCAKATGSKSTTTHTARDSKRY